MSLDKLATQLEGISGDAYPLDDWHPTLCGEMPLVINRRGEWYYMGSEIRRERLVELFAKVLRKESDGKFYLVTPEEKLSILVEDAPFMVVDFELGSCIGDDGHEWQTLWLITNIGDRIPLSKQYPLILRQRDGEARPYLSLWRGLEAVISRNAYYQLVALASEQRVGACQRLLLTSMGQSFSLGEYQVEAPRQPV